MKQGKIKNIILFSAGVIFLIGGFLYELFDFGFDIFSIISSGILKEMFTSFFETLNKSNDSRVALAGLNFIFSVLCLAAVRFDDVFDMSLTAFEKMNKKKSKKPVFIPSRSFSVICVFIGFIICFICIR